MAVFLQSLYSLGSVYTSGLEHPLPPSGSMNWCLQVNHKFCMIHARKAFAWNSEHFVKFIRTLYESHSKIQHTPSAANAGSPFLGHTSPVTNRSAPPSHVCNIFVDNRVVISFPVGTNWWYTTFQLVIYDVHQLKVKRKASNVSQHSLLFLGVTTMPWKPPVRHKVVLAIRSWTNPNEWWTFCLCNPSFCIVFFRTTFSIFKGWVIFTSWLGTPNSSFDHFGISRQMRLNTFLFDRIFFFWIPL